MAPSRHDWKIVDWDVKPQHNQPTNNIDSEDSQHDSEDTQCDSEDTQHDSEDT